MELMILPIYHHFADHTFGDNKTIEDLNRYDTDTADTADTAVTTVTTVTILQC